MSKNKKQEMKKEAMKTSENNWLNYQSKEEKKYYEIATKELNLMGFNSKDINELIEQGKIKRVRRGF